MKHTIGRWIALCGALVVYMTVIYLMVRHPLEAPPHSVGVEHITSVHFVGDIQQTDTGITFRWVDTRVPVILPIHAPGSIVSFTTWLYPSTGHEGAQHDIASIDKRVYTTTSNVFVPRTYHLLSLYGMSTRNDLQATIFVPYNAIGDKPYWAFSGVTATPLSISSLHSQAFVAIFVLLMGIIPLTFSMLCWYATRHTRTSVVIGLVVAALLVWRIPAMYAGYVGMRYLDILPTRIGIAVIIAVITGGLTTIYRGFGAQIQRVLHDIGVHVPVHHRQWFMCATGVLSALWGVVTWYYVDSQKGDWGIHISAAYDIMNHGTLISHFLFHVALIIIHYLSIGLISIDNAAVVLVVIIIWCICLVVWNICARAISQPGFLVGAILLVTFSAPIALLYPLDGHLYTGYFATNVFHNPTVLMVKPFALLHLLLLVHMFNTDTQDNYASELAILWSLSFLGVLAKPSYALAMIPAQAIIVALRIWKQQHWWRRDTVTLVVSASAFVFPLLVQFFMLYYAGSRSLGIKSFGEIMANTCLTSNLSPWTCTLTLYTPIIIKVLASTAILISISIVVPRILSYVDTQLVVVAAIIGMGFAYILVEGVGTATRGDVQDYGNFGWSIQIILFLCMVVALRHFAQMAQHQHQSVWITRIPYLVAVCHVVSGMIWYATQFTRCCW